MLLIFLYLGCNAKKEPATTRQYNEQVECINKTGYNFTILDSLARAELATIYVSNKFDSSAVKLLRYREILESSIQENTTNTLLNAPLLLLEYWDSKPDGTSEFSIYKYEYSAFIVYQNCHYTLDAFWLSANMEDENIVFEPIKIDQDTANYCSYLLRTGLDFSHFIEKNDLAVTAESGEINNLFLITKMGRYNERFCRILPDTRYHLRKLRESVSQAKQFEAIADDLKRMENIALMLDIFDCHSEFLAEKFRN